MKKPAVLLAILLLLGGVLYVLTSDTPTAEAPAEHVEYEDQVAKILVSYTGDPITATQALAELDTELLSAPTAVTYPDSSSSAEAPPSAYALSVFSFRQHDSNRIYLQWILTVNTAEPYAGPLDYVGLEWDTEYGSYYLSAAGGTGCTLQGRDTGIVVFNVEDVKQSSGSYVYGTVQVEPIATGEMEFGSKFIHTYTSEGIVGDAYVSYIPSVSPSAMGGSLGLPHTMSFSVDGNAVTNQRPFWADGVINISDT